MSVSHANRLGCLPKSLTHLAREGGVESTLKLCEALLGSSGTSIGVSLAAQTVSSYERLDGHSRKAFFLALLSRFSPDPEKVITAAKHYAEDPSPRRLWALGQAAEAPRQELLRRLNRAPGATCAILRMRKHLLGLMRSHAELEAVDLDFHHLLSSWFNPGFLQMVQISWRTPADILERIVQQERVHEIQGWEDLRHRLQEDRRCFAFFHPSLPQEPLVFVEVALMHEMPAAIGPLLDSSLPPCDPVQARTAVFYSISACQPGLRGVSLGNFLIKRVVDELLAEFPRLKCFCTLSPIPHFASWLTSQPNRLHKRLECGLDSVNLEEIEDAKDALLLSCAEYLIGRGRAKARTYDPVARFHLSNGARLERINWGANLSRKAIKESLGIMANYLYDPARIERNHECFNQGRTVASKQVRALLRSGLNHGRAV